VPSAATQTDHAARPPAATTTITAVNARHATASGTADSAIPAHSASHIGNKASPWGSVRILAVRVVMTLRAWVTYQGIVLRPSVHASRHTWTSR